MKHIYKEKCQQKSSDQEETFFACHSTPRDFDKLKLSHWAFASLYGDFTRSSRFRFFRFWFQFWYLPVLEPYTDSWILVPRLHV